MEPEGYHAPIWRYRWGPVPHIGSAVRHFKRPAGGLVSIRQGTGEYPPGEQKGRVRHTLETDGWRDEEQWRAIAAMLRLEKAQRGRVKGLKLD